jgi:hypothetical protein
MPDQSVEIFTLTDRRELIKQGIQLDKVTDDIGDIKSLIKDNIISIRTTVTAVEIRVRSLEDFNIKIRTSLWLIGIFFTVLNSVINIAFRFWK